MAAESAPPADVPEISREEIRRRLRDPSFVLVDVLPRDSYAAGHIPGARSLPVGDIPLRARDVLPDRAAEIAVYCAKFTCPLAEQAVGLLRGLGYSNLRHYRGGLADWTDSDGPLEGVAVSVGTRMDSSPARPRRTPPPLSRRRQWGNALVDAIERQSTSHLFVTWLLMVIGCGGVYWLASLWPDQGLLVGGRPVDAGPRGLATAIYFSFVTATSVGYGDVLPVGPVRVLAIAEAVTGLLVFGAVVAKFVSRRQDDLVREIHRVTFEDRLDRVQTNLHLVLSELQGIAALCDDGTIRPERVRTRLESAALVFAGELRAIHDLLYRPQWAPEEAVLGAILASLAASLRELRELLACLPPAVGASPTLDGALATLARLAEDICGECVPRAYAPSLTMWMDQVQETARGIARRAGREVRA